MVVEEDLPGAAVARDTLPALRLGEEALTPRLGVEL